MPIIAITDDKLINTEAVGGVDFTFRLEGDKRILATTVYNHSGEHLTSVVTNSEINSNDHEGLERENFLHREIRNAIRMGCDARKYEDNCIPMAISFSPLLAETLTALLNDIRNGTIDEPAFIRGMTNMIACAEVGSQPQILEWFQRARTFIHNPSAQPTL